MDEEIKLLNEKIKKFAQHHMVIGGRVRLECRQSVGLLHMSYLGPVLPPCTLYLSFQPPSVKNALLAAKCQEKV